MKKPILITIGILIILLIIGVWVYLFMFGAPKDSADVFARFGIGGDEVTPPIPVTPSTVDVTNVGENNAPQKLKQLTTRPVAGAVFVMDGIRYVEQGTGHVHEINLTTGAESLISGTTVAETAGATFSDDGTHVALTTHTITGSKTVVGEITGDGSIKGVSLPVGATDISFGVATNTLFYRIKGSGGSSGYTYDIDSERGVQIFQIPLRDVRVLWGNPMYVYTTPTATQRGYMYEIVKSDLTYVTPGRLGLTGFAYDMGVVITSGGETISSTAYEKSGETITLPLTFIPEKCIENHVSTSTLYCAVPTDIDTGTFPDDWYKGVISYSDILWSIDITEGKATVLSNFFSESGREIDVSKIGTNDTGMYIYFINKNDNTLWMFDTTL